MLSKQLIKRLQLNDMIILANCKLRHERCESASKWCIVAHVGNKKILNRENASKFFCHWILNWKNTTSVINPKAPPLIAAKMGQSFNPITGMLTYWLLQNKRKIQHHHLGQFIELSMTLWINQGYMTKITWYFWSKDKDGDKSEKSGAGGKQYLLTEWWFELQTKKLSLSWLQNM